MPLVERASRETEIGVTILRIDARLNDDTPAARPNFAVLYVLNLQPAQAPHLVEKLRVLRQANPKLKIIPLDHRETHDALDRAGFLDKDKKVAAYWRANGLANMRRLLQYTAVTYLGESGEIEPPAAIPDYGYYHPDSKEVFSTIDELQTQDHWKQDAPVAALLIQQRFWITQDTKVIDAQIRALEREGFNVATLFGHSSQQIRKMLLAVKPDIVIEDRHGSIWEGEGKKPLLEELDVPYLRPISMLCGHPTNSVG